MFGEVYPSWLVVTAQSNIIQILNPDRLVEERLCKGTFPPGIVNKKSLAQDWLVI